MKITLHRFEKNGMYDSIACVRELVQEHNPYIHLSLLFDDDASIQAWIRECYYKGIWHYKDEEEVQYYWICCNKIVVGVASLKKQIKEEWYMDSGHIGICIRKTYRNKGIGRKALLQLFDIAHKQAHLTAILLCCSYENTICRKLCESVHGVLKYEDSYCHYWIGEDIRSMQKE